MQFLLDFVKRELAVFYQQQTRRAGRNNLSAQLAANAAACTGDHHDLPTDIARHQFCVGRYNIAPQQIIDIQLAKLLHLCTATGQLCHIGHAAHVHRQIPQAADDGIALLARQAGNRQQHIGHLAVTHHLRQGADRPHLRPIDAAADFGQVVINKADKGVLARAVDGSRRLQAGFSRAVNQQAPLLGCAVAAAVHEQAANKRAVSPHQQQKQQGLQNAHAARHVRGVANKNRINKKQQAVHGNGLHGRNHGGKTGVAKDGAIQAKLDHNGNSQQRCQQVGAGLVAMGQFPQVQPQANRQP